MTAIGVLHGGDRGTARSILFSRDTATARVIARFQCWLVKSGSHIILIDAGIPADDFRVGAIAGARTTRDLLPDGIDASSVTDVVLTHLHWDHVGDIDAFENAVIHVQTRELDFLRSAWFDRPALRNLFAAQSKLDWILANPRLHPLSTDASIAKGVMATWVGGHTPGSQIVLVALDGHRVVFTGDAVNTLHNLAHDVPPGILWSMPEALDALARIRQLKDAGFAVIPSHEAVELPGAGCSPPAGLGDDSDRAAGLLDRLTLGVPRHADGSSVDNSEPPHKGRPNHEDLPTRESALKTIPGHNHARLHHADGFRSAISGYGRDMGYRARQGKQPVDAEHAEDEAGQVPLIQVTADTDVPAPSDSASKPDIVTEDDGSGMAGGASGSSGGSGMPGHPDAAHR